MIDPIEHTEIILNTDRYTPIPNMPFERNGSNVKRDIAKSSSKYILVGNKIVFERYDRNGKLISRVPWTAHSISEKA